MQARSHLAWQTHQCAARSGVKLPLHHAHDYRALVRGWRVVAREGRMTMQVLTHVAGLPIYLLESGKREAPAVYLSAGVHGDEPAAAWGLLAWAQQNISLLRQGPFVISPCLNPIGLIGNTRVDHRGVDLNRSFHLASDEVCGPWLRAIQGRQLIAGLCLHEDYDAQGCYVYELGLHKEIFSRAVLLRCTGTIPADHRRLIDRRRAADGIIRRRKAPPELPVCTSIRSS